MLDKSAYYHGAALTLALDDVRLRSLRKRDLLGYVVNDDIFLFLKYTTKAHSPWRFGFDQEDIDRCAKMSSVYRRVVFGLVCGGDGVCGLTWCQGKELLSGESGWIAAARKHKQRYEVWGSQGELKKKVSLGRWPAVIFESEAIKSDAFVEPTYAATEA
jgi:hypothetical protein